MEGLPSGSAFDEWLRRRVGASVVVDGDIEATLLRFDDRQLVFELRGGEWIIGRERVQRLERPPA